LVLKWLDMYNRVFTPKDLRVIAGQSLILEVSSFKPGNISPYNDYNGLYAKYIESSISFGEALEHVLSDNMGLGDGADYISSTLARSMAQEGRNHHLGQILVLLPLAMVANGLEEQGPSLPVLLHELLDKAGYKDTLGVWRAINTAKPKSLVDVPRLDARSEESYAVIESDRIPLKEWMAVGKEKNLICREYVTDFSITLDELSPLFNRQLRETNSILRAIESTSLYIMSKYHDTHIIGTHGFERAEEIRELAARKVKENGYPLGKEHIMSLHKDLISDGANPGTTADLVAGCVFHHVLSKRAEEAHEAR